MNLFKTSLLSLRGRFNRRNLFKGLGAFGIGGTLLSENQPPAVARASAPENSTTFIAIDDYISYATVDSQGNLDWAPVMEWLQDNLFKPPFNVYHGFSIYFGPKDYRFSRPIQLIRTMSLIGSGGFLNSPGTSLTFLPDANKVQQSGIICLNIPPVQSSGITGKIGAGSIIERMELYGVSATSNPDAHGVVMYGRMKLRDMYISGFSGDGIHIDASTADANTANANGWQIENCRIDDFGNHGLFVHGSDANVGRAVAVDCDGVKININQGKWGIYDSSTSVNTYIACQVANCSQGAYAATSNISSVLFLNCYTESIIPSLVTAPNMVIGGAMQVQGNGIWLMSGEFMANFRNNAFQVPNNLDPNEIVMRLGSQSLPKVAFELHSRKNVTVGGEEVLSDDWYALHYERQEKGWWELVYENLDVPAPLRFSTAEALEGWGHLWLPQGFFIGFSDRRLFIWTSAHIPTQDDLLKTYTWNVGDRILNKNPVPGDPINGYEGWICTQAGQPGVWKGYGLIEV